jgi:hypothetical protein
MGIPSRAFRLNGGAISFAIGVGVFLLSAAIEGSLHAFNIHGIWEWADNCASALATGLIVYLYERRQYRKHLARLRVIADMNHHVRNALQSIVFVAGGTVPQEQQLKVIRDSVNRIQWTLTEVLPVEVLTPHSTEWPREDRVHSDAA